MRMGTSFRLIDFDASVSFNQYVGTKYSSAYCPCEMLETDHSENGCTIFVRTYNTDDDGAPIKSDLPYSLLLANPSYDMWSLGATFYQVLEINMTHDICRYCFVLRCTQENPYSLQMTKVI